MAIRYDLAIDLTRTARLLGPERVGAVWAAAKDALSSTSLDYLAEVRRALRRSRIVGLVQSWGIKESSATEFRAEEVVGSAHPMAQLRETGGLVLPGRNTAKCGPRRGQKTRALPVPLLPEGKNGPCPLGPMQFRPIPPKGGKSVGLLIPKGKTKATHLLRREVRIKPRPVAAQALKTILPEAERRYASAIEGVLAVS